MQCFFFRSRTDPHAQAEHVLGFYSLRIVQSSVPGVLGPAAAGLDLGAAIAPAAVYTRRPDPFARNLPLVVV